MAINTVMIPLSFLMFKYVQKRLDGLWIYSILMIYCVFGLSCWLEEMAAIKGWYNPLFFPPDDYSRGSIYVD